MRVGLFRKWHFLAPIITLSLSVLDCSNEYHLRALKYIDLDLDLSVCVLSGWFRRSAGGEGKGRALVPGRHNQLGHWVRRAQPPGRLHPHLPIQGVDPGQRDVNERWAAAWINVLRMTTDTRVNTSGDLWRRWRKKCVIPESEKT